MDLGNSRWLVGGGSDEWVSGKWLSGGTPWLGIHGQVEGGVETEG